MSTEKIYSYFQSSPGISTDSRNIKPGEVFYALKGENFDGHQYVSTAIEKGASIAVIDNEDYTSEKTILVEDVLQSLQDLGNYHRKRLDVPVLAITGSNGKTTTKELIHAVLKKKFKVHATKGNLNNHIGVPLTLLSAPSDTELLIVEMGANHIGEIHDLCLIADPNFGLITNIGKAHLEGFGSYEGVIQAKTELYNYLSLNKGTIFFNYDDDILKNKLPQSTTNIPYPNDIIFSVDQLSLNFSLIEKDEVFFSQLYGDYNSKNILAAFAIGREFEISNENICEAICAYSPKMNRSQIISLDRTTLVLDAYNANPSSVTSSLRSFIALNSDKQKKVIFGDMKELGVDAIKMHKDILTSLSKIEKDNVFLVGELYGLADSENCYMKFKDVEKLIAYSKDNLSVFNDSIVLIKASRSMRLERWSDFIISQQSS